MKKSNLLLPLLFVLLNVANANPADNPKTCINSPDETGCLLNISKIKALKINDVNKQAEAVGDILKTTAGLNRSDYEIMVQSFQLLKHKKLDLEPVSYTHLTLPTIYSV